MIGSLVSLLEKFTELLKHRKQIRDDRFNNVVTPIYQGLEKVQADYLQFMELSKAMLDSDVSISDIAKKLMEDRLEQEAIRSGITSMIECFREDQKNIEYLGFYDAILRYFYSTDLKGRDTPSNYLLHEMKQWANSEVIIEFSASRGDNRQARKILENIISDVLQGLRENWKMVSKEYAKLLSQK